MVLGSLRLSAPRWEFCIESRWISSNMSCFGGHGFLTWQCRVFFMAQQKKTNLGSIFCGNLGSFSGSHDTACLTLQKSTVTVCSSLTQIVALVGTDFGGLVSQYVRLHQRGCVRREKVQ